MPEPIAFTYEADHHCPSCTAARFGEACEGTDNEGNEVGAVFNYDEWFEASTPERDHLVCGDCGAVLAIAGPADGFPEQAGREAGEAAASWVEVDSPEQAAAILRQIEDCELDIQAPLSGEWADGLTARGVLSDLGCSEDDDDADSILSEWEEGYYAGFEAEVVRRCQYQLEGSES